MEALSLLLIVLRMTLLMSAVFIVLPLIFFSLVWLFGHYFGVTIHKESWIAKTNITVLRALARKIQS